MADSSYGDSYSAVESADLQQQAARRAALEHSQALLQQSFQNLQRAHEEQDKLAYQYKALEDQKQQHARQLDVTSKYYDWLMKQETPGQTRAIEFDISGASKAAQAGMFDPARFPHLTPDQQKSFAEESLRNRPLHEENWKYHDTITSGLNKRIDLEQRKVAIEKEFGITPGASTLDDPFKTGIPGFRSESEKHKATQKEYEQILDKLKHLPNPNDPKIKSLIPFDPDSNRFINPVSKPPWTTVAPPGAAAPQSGNRALNVATPPDDQDNPLAASGAGSGPAPGAGAQTPDRSLPWEPVFQQGNAGALRALPPGATAADVNAPAPAMPVRVKSPTGVIVWVNPENVGLALKRGGILIDQPTPKDFSPFQSMMRTGYRRGGVIRGPGSGTSDSVPIRASAGEYVIPAAAVRIPGVLPVLEHIRRMGNERRINFADGGLVEGPMVPPPNMQIGGPRENVMGADGMTFQPGRSGGGSGLNIGNMDWGSLIKLILSQMGGGNRNGGVRSVVGGYLPAPSPSTRKIADEQTNWPRDASGNAVASGYDVYQQTGDPRAAYQHAITNKTFYGNYDQFAIGQLGIDPSTGVRLPESSFEWLK